MYETDASLSSEPGDAVRVSEVLNDWGFDEAAVNRMLSGQEASPFEVSVPSSAITQQHARDSQSMSR
ncbi:MAG TPA: hypothetical protein VJS44_12855 [Pyrinomonadaceae bacterium]|nr:hypothetical protein [Pyrinomonadaceae bacterium]